MNTDRRTVKLKEVERVWLNTEQLCDYLHISENMYYKLRREGLPYCKIGKSVRHDKRKVDKFVSRYEVRERPVDEVLAELRSEIVTRDTNRNGR